MSVPQPQPSSASSSSTAGATGDPTAAPPPAAPRPRTALVVGAVVLGVAAVLLGYLVLAGIWGVSETYGNATPLAAVPWALLPALALAGCVRCVLALRGRERPHLLLLLVAFFVVLGIAAYALGYAGDSRHRSAEQARAAFASSWQYDVLTALPMAQVTGNDMSAATSCSTDGDCSLTTWVAGSSVDASVAEMSRQMQAAGWRVVSSSATGATYSSSTATTAVAGDVVVQATVVQADDKGGTDVRVRVVSP